MQRPHAGRTWCYGRAGAMIVGALVGETPGTTNTGGVGMLLRLYNYPVGDRGDAGRESQPRRRCAAPESLQHR
jgi:hypothetical protein